MRAFWIFLHLLGGVLWIGGGMAAMFVSLAAKGLGRAEQGTVARLVAKVYARMIAPGAAMIVLSGLFLTMTYMGAINRGDIQVVVSPWIMAMQGLGILGAAMIFAVTFPAVNRLTRIDPVTQPEAFDAVRRRQRLTGMIATICAFIGLLAGALYR
ncbi:MAG TPA: hypothetical protein VFI13_12570 [Gemmatimonadales bacterium]|nr:hypothetical protein [Gemmatimonadales bacterium]